MTSSAIMIRTMEKDDIVTALAISDEVFGHGYTEEFFLHWALSSSDDIPLVAEIHGHTVGFALGQLMSPHELAPIVRNEVTGNKRGKVGLIKTLAVTQSAQGLGLGSSLARTLLNQLSLKGATDVYSVAWEHGGVVPARKTLESHGLVEVARVPHYWREDSLEAGYACTACGEPPCSCSAIIFHTPIQTRGIL